MFNEFLLFLFSIGPIFFLFGLFVVSVIANASLFFPLPIDVLIIPLASVDFFGLGVLTPLVLGFTVALGATFGEFSGYFIGLSGVKIFEAMKKQEVEKLKHLRDKLEVVGIPLVFFFAITPLPFDLIGVAAGLAKYSKQKFFIGCFLGKLPRYVVLAYAGFFGVTFLINLLGG